tara:strand:- start:147 stop:959 length:813 start_codon:yes stop_codon:yes gene_type:complete
MTHIQIEKELIEQLIEISKEAGQAILEVYNTNFDYQIKEDLSPLTKADTLSHNIICERIRVLTPDIPILSEENSDIPFNTRSSWKQYWLVDPLDGTKEFIKRNGEFTVNIALIENNTPVIGIINVPVSNEIYWGSSIYGSFHREENNQKERLFIEKNNSKLVRIVASRSHPSKTLGSFLEVTNDYKILTKGSSLKFCLIANGTADIYPRFGPTSEWDTAAGQAIVEFAGGSLITIDKKPLKYNLSENYLNPYFIVASREDLALNFLSHIK